MGTSTVDQTMSEKMDDVLHINNAIISTSASLKTTAKGVVLVPQPSDDPQDPLNWHIAKKCLMLGIITLCSFAGSAISIANSAGFVVQAELYKNTPLDISYGVSACVAGLAVGPFIWTPLARRYGRSAIVFWGMLATLATSVWGAECTSQGDYISFVISRLLAGLFGSVGTTVGAGLIYEVFFLHQRGKAFTTYSVMLLVGTIAEPTFSGFIITFSKWPVQYWYNVGLESAAALLTFLFLEETGFTRPGGPVYPSLPRTWVRNRMATLCFTQRVVPELSLRDMASLVESQFLICIEPVSLLCGGYLFVNFGWAVAVNTLLGIFLQTPVAEGGYGFTALENSYFLFTSWIGFVVAQVYSHNVSDRLPIAICRKRGSGIWRPEYRLHALWLPGLILLPSGLGIFGSALKHHYHPAVLALGSFLISSSAIVSVPIIDTYVAECFVSSFYEANAAMNFYRLTFGIAIPFFIFPWTAAVGINWVFGMMAFFTVLTFSWILLLIFKGHDIRQRSMGHVAKDEEGLKLTQTRTKDQV